VIIRVSIRRRYVATVFKHIKRSIIDESVSIYRSLCLVQAVRKKRKEVFEVPLSSLVGCVTVSNAKRRLSTGEYCWHLQDWAVEE